MVDYTSMAIGGLTLDVPKCQTVLRGLICHYVDSSEALP